MGARPIRAVSLLITSVVLTALLMPGGAAARPDERGPATGPDPAAGTVADFADLPAEPPATPAKPPAPELYGADCDTRIDGSLVVATCHNPYPETDLLRLHVECDRWWDVDGDSAAVPLDAAGRTRLTGRCWKEVRTAWVSHERPSPPTD
ncbi:hypothetical protein [Streptomyces sp. RerS4]|uniref:hypothetical protein n=1 Tax=Streptomyces sp. RerS4 TaxID=2942449 RepID=UPI00201C8AA6|nr:hypothetical protein [Streptomyces sp. RerS4]UQX00535.1 hypothetical protein M4D82_08345 [Streptomyces sp. RerS4]